MRFSAAWCDGMSLYAVRAASDEQVPSLFYRYSHTRGGHAVVSEPLELDEDGWMSPPPGQVVRFSRDGSADILPFA